MIGRMLIAGGVVFLLFGGWMALQQAGRVFARRHPEFGRFREEGGECGKTCGCANWKNCAMKKPGKILKHPSDQSDRTDRTD